MTFPEPHLLATLDRPSLIAAIPTIPAGRILDGLIAREVLGWEAIPGPTLNYSGPIANEPILIPPGSCPDRLFTLLPPRGSIPWYYFSYQWSTTDRDMLHLLRMLMHVPHGWSFTLERGHIATVGDYHARADTRALAVARAALLWGCNAR